MTRNVVVTGMGAVTPLGASVGDFWEGLKAGRNGIVRREYKADRFSLTLPTAPVDGLEERLAALGPQFKRADRFSQFAALAAEEAVAQSGLDFSGELGPRTACIIGTGGAGSSSSSGSAVSCCCSPCSDCEWSMPATSSHTAVACVAPQARHRNSSCGLR